MTSKFKSYEEYLCTLKDLTTPKELTEFYSENGRFVHLTVPELRSTSNVSFLDVLTVDEVLKIANTVPYLLGNVTFEDIFKAVNLETYDLVEKLITTLHVRKPSKSISKLTGKKAIKLLEVIIKNLNNINIFFYNLDPLLGFVEEEAFTKTDIKLTRDVVLNLILQPRVDEYPNVFRFLTTSPVGAELFNPQVEATKSVNAKKLFYFLALIATRLSPQNFFKTVQYTRNTLSLQEAALIYSPLASQYLQIKKCCLKALLKLKTNYMIDALPDFLKVTVEDSLIDILSPEDCFQLLELIDSNLDDIINVNVETIYERVSILAVADPKVTSQLEHFKYLLKAKTDGVITLYELKRLSNFLERLPDDDYDDQVFIIKKIVLSDLPSEVKVKLTRIVARKEKPYKSSSPSIANAEKEYGVAKYLLAEINETLKQKSPPDNKYHKISLLLVS